MDDLEDPQNDNKYHLAKEGGTVGIYFGEMLWENGAVYAKFEPDVYQQEMTTNGAILYQGFAYVLTNGVLNPDLE